MQYWKTIYRENILEKISIEWENSMLSYLARLRSLADLERDGDFFLRSRDLDLKGTLAWQNRFFLSYLIIHLKPPVFLETSISTSNLSKSLKMYLRRYWRNHIRGAHFLNKWSFIKKTLKIWNQIEFKLINIGIDNSIVKLHCVMHSSQLVLLRSR